VNLLNLTSIKFRLLFLTGLALVGLVATTLIGLLQLSHFNGSVANDLRILDTGTSVMLEVAAANVDFKTQVQEWKNILIRGNDPESFEKYKKHFVEKANKVQQRLKKIHGALQAAGSPSSKEVDLLAASHKEMLDKYLSALSAFDPANPEAGKVVDKSVKGIDREATEVMNKLSQTLEKKISTDFSGIILSNQSDYAASRNALLVTAAVVILLVVVLTLVTIRRITDSVHVLEESIARATDGLDLTVRVPISGQDEIAKAGMALNALFEQLQAILKGMRSHAEEVAQTSNQLSGSVGQLAGSVDRQNEATSSMAAAAEELSVSVAHVSEGALMAKATSLYSLQLSEQGRDITEQNVAAMSTATNDVNATAGVIEALGQRVQSIGLIASVIKDIADQTNLLALNAAIEAARAGEQGRGFAVVADEVRKLAERTSGATNEIAQVISTVQLEADKAVSSVGGVVAKFNDIASSTRAAGQAILEIRSGSEQVVNMTLDISNALGEQKTASESIAQKIEVIASMSESNSVAMNSVNSASQRMDGLSQTMHQDLSRFVV